MGGNQRCFPGRAAGGVKTKTLEEIKSILLEHKAELRERYTPKKHSDIDILVEFEELPGLLGFLHLKEYLSELLGMKVDLVHRESIRDNTRDSPRPSEKTQPLPVIGAALQ